MVFVFMMESLLVPVTLLLEDLEGWDIGDVGADVWRYFIKVIRSHRTIDEKAQNGKSVVSFLQRKIVNNTNYKLLPWNVVLSMWSWRTLETKIHSLFRCTKNSLRYTAYLISWLLIQVWCSKALETLMVWSYMGWTMIKSINVASRDNSGVIFRLC